MPRIFRASLLALTVLSATTSFALASHKHPVPHSALDRPGVPHEACSHKTKKHDMPTVKMSVLLKASPEVVWEAIKHERISGGDERKLLSYDGSKAVLEEKFASLPIVGAASCVYTEAETPIHRIDYSLVHSNRFQAFEGSWVLTPAKNGTQTIVELSNALDPGIRVPFWQEITKVAASRHVKKRLDEISAYVETLQSHKIAGVGNL